MRADIGCMARPSHREGHHDSDVSVAPPIFGCSRIMCGCNHQAMLTPLRAGEEILADVVLGLKAFCPETWRRDHVCSDGLVFAEGLGEITLVIRWHRDVLDN